MSTAPQPTAPGHAHDHHNHAVGSSTNRLALALAVVAAVLVAEVIAAAVSGSLALLADAGHMATDSAGLVIALVAARLAQLRDRKSVV